VLHVKNRILTGPGDQFGMTWIVHWRVGPGASTRSQNPGFVRFASQMKQVPHRRFAPVRNDMDLMSAGFDE
jgi:hypothetical protein